MNILKDKKILISIIIVTILIITINIAITINQYNIYQNKINIVIANIVGTLKQNNPEIEEQEIISILNLKQDAIQLGYNVLEKYGIEEEASAIKGIEEQKNGIILINITTIIIYLIIMMIILVIYLKNKNKKIKDIVNYIEEINKKNYNLKIEENKEDELSILKNELYKITIMLKEQAENSNKDKKVLQTSLEDISHQIKTPITSISIMLDNIIENPNMDEKTRQKFIHEINRQIEWIKWLVISLLKLSKLDSDTVKFIKQEINVKKLIEDVKDNLSIPLEIKEQEIIINGKEETFFGDYNWEKEALTNIIKNCIEHTPENKKIHINIEENIFYTKITIQDEGTGINKKDLKHIFERFYKGENASQNSIGIGLALAKSIIEKDNGYIKCMSELGKGTIFEIKYIKQK